MGRKAWEEGIGSPLERSSFENKPFCHVALFLPSTSLLPPHF
jgi:hypothetical protein